QDDLVLRELGHEKMLGHDLLVGIVARTGETERGVYLPRGTWVDFARGEGVDSVGQWVDGVPEYRGALFQLPLFARAGAIVPMMAVDASTLNVVGMRKEGSRNDDLLVRVYPGADPSAFTLYEDDGATIAYLDGEV